MRTKTGSRRYEIVALPAPKPSIDTCNACRKLFPRVNLRLCTTCALVEENRFELVAAYLRDNDGAAIGDVSGATGVSASDVRRFRESGRLVQIEAHCTCGGIGERCKYCRSRLSSGFRELQESMQRDQESRGPAEKSGPQRTQYVRRIRRVGEE